MASTSSLAASRQRGSEIEANWNCRMDRIIWTGKPDDVGEVPDSILKDRTAGPCGQCETGLTADNGPGEDCGPSIGHVRWPPGELLGTQGKFVIPVGGLSACRGEDGGFEPVEHLLDPGGIEAEGGHELSGGHLLPLPGEERLQTQQVRRVPRPRGEDRQRAEQADPGAGRTRLALRPVQSGALVAAGGREYVPLPADEFGDHLVLQVQVRHQVRIAVGQRGRVVFGDDHRRMGSPQHVVLGVLDNRVDRALLGRCRGGQWSPSTAGVWFGSMVARPLPFQELLSRIASWVVRIRERWIFRGSPVSLSTRWRTIRC